MYQYLTFMFVKFPTKATIVQHIIINNIYTIDHANVHLYCIYPCCIEILNADDQEKTSNTT